MRVRPSLAAAAWNGLGPMPGGAVPNDDDCARLITQPFSHALQELNHMFFVAVTLVPDETLSCAEIVAPYQLMRSESGAQPLIRQAILVLFGPGVAQVDIAVDVGFINIDQTDLLATELFIQLLKAFHKGRTFLWVGFLEHFLALFPAQPRCLQNPVQRAAGEIAIHDC